MENNKHLLLARYVAKTLNYSEETIIEILRSKGFDIRKSPNLKLTSEQISIIEKHHSGNQKVNNNKTGNNGKSTTITKAKEKYTHKHQVETRSSNDSFPNVENIVVGIQHHVENLIGDIQHNLLSEQSKQSTITKRETGNNISSLIKIKINEYIKFESEVLDLSDLEIYEIPEEILILDNLKSLDISGNKITKLQNLPSQIEVLHANYNQITNLANIPAKLKFLSISHNDILRIENLPDSLIELNASNNKISTLNKLPTSLVNLNLNNNQLQAITIVRHLSSLRICNNEIMSIVQVEGLENIDELYIYGNPIQDLPEHITEKDEYFNCINSVRNWINELERKSEKNTQIKLIILGNSNVGKSSIIWALKKMPYDSEIKSTHGISIETLNIKDDDQPVDLQIWDLGGQEIYYGTHRMFMMSQSVQLVVFDTITEEISVSPDRLHETETIRNTKLSFYINRVQELSPLSQIIIVQNKIEQDDSMPEYLTEYISKNRYRKISVLNNRNIRSLLAAIHDAAIDLNIYGQQVPYYWEKVRRYFHNNLMRSEVERLRLIDKKEFKNICIKEKVLPEGIDDLLDYLHNIGAVYNRQELGENIIVDQVWALKAIYKIFDRDSKFYFEMRNVYYGKCSVRTLFDDFDKTENGYSIDDKWIFIKYMESCGLCFSIKHDDNEVDTLDTFYVFPEFLPSVKPNFVRLWDLKKSNRQVIKRKFKFMPYYPLHKFISKFGNKTMHNFLWRNGILICINSDNFDGFLVEADFENHTIQITLDETELEWKDAIISQLQIGKEIIGEEWQIINDSEGLLTVDVKEQKSASQLLSIKNVVQDNSYEGLNIALKRRLVISYAKEDIKELDLLIKYLKANKIEYWYDEKLSNRSGWEDEINSEFEKADGYIILLSADYMNSNKKYIHETEIPLMYKRMREQKLYCTVLTVKNFSLDPTIHGDICQIPCYKKGAVLPAIIDYDRSEFFMNEFLHEEILKKL